VLLFATINPPVSLGIVAQSLAANCYRIVAIRRLKAIDAQRPKYVFFFIFQFIKISFLTGSQGLGQTNCAIPH
jgi:hypothetical protein